MLDTVKNNVEKHLIVKWDIDMWEHIYGLNLFGLVIWPKAEGGGSYHYRPK